jgi:alpha-methylacyl-CoA racemase
VADVVIDPYRPGVMDRIGAGPKVLCKRNPRLIYAHLYGFRPDSTSVYAQRAGHDINYLAVSGVLSLLGRKNEIPAPPANILADFAGGGLVCVVGILLAVLHRSLTGRGQVVSANMVDGTSYLATFARQQLCTPNWNQQRGENLLDGGAPFYEVYETLDGRYVAVGAQEPQFYKILLEGLELRSAELPDQWDRVGWSTMKQIFRDKFKGKTQAAWREIFDHTDSCVTPVLPMSEIEKPLQPLVVMSTFSNPLIEIQEMFPVLEKGSGAENVLVDWLGDGAGEYLSIDGQSRILSRQFVSKL